MIPYNLDGRNRHYYPDVAARDKAGRCYIVEVKPIYRMYRETTLAEVPACLGYVKERGMGFLLVDARGRTVAENASVPYDAATANEIEELIDRKGDVSFWQDTSRG